jgi:hypothetical protein
MSKKSTVTVSMTQSEQMLEDGLVAQLVAQGYAKVAVTDEASMLANLKAQLGDGGKHRPGRANIAKTGIRYSIQRG